MHFVTSIEQVALERGMQLGIQQGIQQALRQGIQHDLLDAWTKGWAEGWSEGWTKGRLEGATCIINRQLTRRFGPLAPETRARLEAATLDQLEHWAENILDATTLEDVFKDD